MVSKKTKYLIAAAAAATVLYSSSLNASTVKAEGTRNMVSNGGYRPYTWATDTTTAGITRRTILKVYAKAGEKIYLGSSVYANSNDIIVKDPSGAQKTYDVLESGKGYIDDINKEAAGPLPNANGYTPYIIDVNQTGIWQVEFKGDESKSANPTFQPASYDFKTTQSGTVASWDITVRDGSGNEKIGRVFTSYISIFMGNNLADNTKKVLSSDFYVLTKDGYVYKTGMNGIDPNGFMFFSNNRGFVDKTNNMTLYHSVMDTSQSTGDNLGGIIGNVAPQLPNVADTTTDLTHNVFFNYPDKELPSGLKPTAIVPAIASDFSFMGADGANLTAKYSEGGAFTFNSDKQGSYKLIIDTNKDGNYDAATERVIENVAVKGKNTVVWDGKDAQGNPLPIGAYKAKLTMKGGEYHFPVLDAEYNPFGITIELLNPPSAFQGGVNKNTVYYNESDYKTSNGLPVNLNAAASGNGINPINALGGIDSSNGAHKYWYDPSNGGYGISGYGKGGYGNWKGIDTWTYFPGNSITLDFNVADVVVPANGFVSGYIFNDKDKNRAFNSGEPGLSGVTVKVTDKNGTVHTTTTDNSGYYAINIPQGNYNLVVNPPAGYSLTTANANQSGTLSSSNQIINNIGYYVATDVAITAAASPSQTVLGHEVIYTLTIKNNGPVTATNVVVNDALPAGIQYVSDNSGGLYDSNTGNISIGNLAAGESRSISIVGNINSRLSLPASITNVATVSLTEPDTDVSSNEASVVISPKANSIPAATSTFFNVNNDAILTGNLNGTDADGDTITYSSQISTQKGTMAMNPDGAFTYTPNPGAYGDDIITVTLDDRHGGISTATVRIAINSIPVLSNINTETDFNKPVTGKITGTDADGNALTYSKVSEPGKGTVVVNSNGTFTYTPKAGAVGTDSFKVEVSDGNGGKATATVTVKIDTPPTVSEGAANIAADFNKPVLGKIDAADVDKDTLTYTIGTAPSKGTLVVNQDGTFTYTPNTEETGDDSFTVLVSDGHGGSVEKTINVKIDTPPTLAAGNSDVKADFNKPATGKIDAADADKDTLTYTVGKAPSKGTAVVNPDGTFTYTPNPGATGDDSFTVIVSDGHGGSTTATVSVKIDTPPTLATGNSDAKADFNKPVAGKIDAADADKDTLTYIVGTAPSKGTAVVNPDGTWTYTPNTGATGADSFTVVVSDGHGGSVTATENVKIDTPPTTANYNAEANFNEPVSGIVMGTDVDKDTLTYTVGTAPSKGKVTVNPDGTWTYTPNTGSTGTDSFTVVVSDGHGGSVTSTVNVKIDTPPTAADINKSTDFNKPATGKIDAADADKDTLTYAVGTAPSKGKVTVNPDGTFTYTPNNGAAGADSFTIAVNDGHGGTAVATVKIIIDTPPAVPNYNRVTPYNQSVSGIVAANDADNDSLDYTLVAKPSNGYVEVDNSGRWTYTPNLNFAGADSFKVSVNDGHGGSAISEINITVKDKVNLVGTITDEENGRIIPNTKLDLYDLRGKLIYSTTTDANGNYSINNVKLGLYEFVIANEKYAKKIVDIDVEPASETEYTVRKDFKLVNSLSYTLKLDANPRTIIGDGKSTSYISARITDKNNNPVANALVVFTAPIGTFPNGATAITDSNGVARVLFQSVKITGTENKVIPVTATVNDDARNLHVSDQIFMTFEPGIITGVVVDNETGLPVSNAVVEVSKDFDGDGIADFYSKMITGADGKYSIAIPKGNVEYNVSITKLVTIGDRTVEVKYNQKSQAGTITGVGGEAFAAEETAAGVILAKQPDGKALFFDDYSKFNIDVLSQADFADVLNGKAKLNSINGISASIGNGSLDKGVFEAEGLEKGKSYVLALSYTLPSGEKLIVGSVNVCVNTDGQINITSALIDPYGTITDSITKGIISGADVKLYYADTARNRAAGRTPNTLVKLPLISGFEPADNNNPQIDDINGKYAFMVFPNADYYVVVSKDGYETYTSETISVGSAIVKKDIEMIAKAKAAASTANTTSTPSKISAVLPKTGSPIDLNSLGILGTVILLSGIGLSLKPKKKEK